MNWLLSFLAGVVLCFSQFSIILVVILLLYSRFATSFWILTTSCRLEVELRYCSVCVGYLQTVVMISKFLVFNNTFF